MTIDIKGYIVSLDPAKLHDFSALSVLRITREASEKYNRYKLIALERQRRQPYEITAAWFKKAFMNPLLWKDVTFKPIPLIDSGGVGEPTADIIQHMGVPIRRIKYTGGDGFKVEGRNVTVSKALMVSCFLGIIEGGRFTMPSGASFEGLFKSELRDFRGELGKLGRVRFEAEEGSHDDLVMSVCQAVWFVEQFIKHRPFKAPVEAVVYGDSEAEMTNSFTGPMPNRGEDLPLSRNM